MWEVLINGERNDTGVCENGARALRGAVIVQRRWMSECARSVGRSVPSGEGGGVVEKCSQKNLPTATSSTIKLTCPGLGSDPSHGSGEAGD
jgi:hypothetical protein